MLTYYFMYSIYFIINNNEKVNTSYQTLFVMKIKEKIYKF